MRRVALAGLMYAGKDYVADQLSGYQKISVSDFLLDISERIFGTRDKKIVRNFIQKIALWGWDCDFRYSEASVERALITEFIHKKAEDGFEPWWLSYGKVETFWIDSLLYRYGIQTCNKRISNFQERRFAFVNHRLRCELDPLQKANFEIFLVAASQETRLKRSGNTLTQKQDFDVSEQYARELYGELPDERIIWNDDATMPLNRNFLTVEKFLAEVHEDA